MAHYTGPKGKINRRLGIPVYENIGARKALDRRDSPPGMHPRPRKLSGYGTALIEKQKLKHHYGWNERPLRRVFDMAQRHTGDTGEALLSLCERRLDNVIRRGGLTKTRPQARQGIAHGHFYVNGRKMSAASYLVRPGDVISVKNRPNLVNFYGAMQADADIEIPHWLNAEKGRLSVTVSAIPGPGDFSVPVNVALVVEILSR
jgi:small subunit ribosomal protein S4